MRKSIGRKQTEGEVMKDHGLGELLERKGVIG